MKIIVLITLLFSQSLYSKSIDDSIHEMRNKFATQNKDWRMEEWTLDGYDTTLYNIPRSIQISGQSKHQSWSGPSWSYGKGGINRRYNDSSYEGFLKRNNDKGDIVARLNRYIQNNLFQIPNFVSEHSPLSASEKYDALLDDEYYGMTQYNWKRMVEDTQTYFDVFNQYPTYFGYCDGWAIASTVHNRPLKAVEMKSPSGRHVVFSPHDIKAIVSAYHQFNPQLRYKLLGSRCLEGEKCGLLNPALFHLAMINSIGRDGKAVIFDSAESPSVWNKVFKSYEVKYFNPHNSISTSRKGTDVMKYRHDYIRPGYQRDPRAEYIVGVELNTKVVRLNQNNNGNEVVDDFVFYYELELSKNMHIVGGEWLAKMHGEPDFLWQVEDGLDLFDTDEDVSNGISYPLRKEATWKTHTYGEFHPAIVKYLIEESIK